MVLNKVMCCNGDHVSLQDLSFYMYVNDHSEAQGHYRFIAVWQAYFQVLFGLETVTL